MPQIHATDLMVGDWVRRKDTGECVPVVDFELVSKEFNRYVIRVDNLHNHFIELYEEDIEGVPLTAEILENNGFELCTQNFTSHRVYKFGFFDYIECHDDHSDKNYDYCGIGVYKEYRHFHVERKYLHEIMKIHYVHEFQHALKNCGINKQITL